MKIKSARKTGRTTQMLEELRAYIFCYISFTGGPIKEVLVLAHSSDYARQLMFKFINMLPVVIQDLVKIRKGTPMLELGNIHIHFKYSQRPIYTFEDIEQQRYLHEWFRGRNKTMVIFEDHHIYDSYRYL